jgi:capsular polysaccharide transport system permease protein
LQRSPLKIQIDVLYALVLREMHSRLGRTRVGFFWALLEPIAHLLVPVVLFGFIFHRTIPGFEYPVFLLFGLLPYLLFKNACTQTMDAVNNSVGVLAYRQVHLMDVFVSKLIASTLLECFLISLVLFGLALFNYQIVPWRPVEVLLVMVLAILLGFGLGIVLAAVISFIPDARTIIRIAFMPLYLASGVAFPVTRFPNAVVDLLAINPVLHIVEMGRWAGIEHYKTIHQLDIPYPIAIMLVVLCAGLALYRLRVVNKVTR